MHLYEIPIICVLAGLALYAVLGGADFGAGLWQLASILDPRRSPAARLQAERIREHAHHSMGPVWEANHVWLIFVLTVTWTAYPVAFGSIASTLAVPLLLAGLGVVFRGAAYALRSGSSSASELGAIDTVFSLSSILTPFALGAVVGAIVTGRVPVGNAAGQLFSSWLGPTSIFLGVMAVAISAYMAAVYLAADAARHAQEELTEQFRARALLAGAVAGAAAIAGLVVLNGDAHRIYTRLLHGPGLVGVILSLLGGLATLALVAARRFEPARVSAALAVAGMIAGWALAQQPLLLPHLTLAQAAAPHETLVAVLVAIVMGGAILFPSLGLLFGLVLRGGFDPPDAGEQTAGRGEQTTGRGKQTAGRGEQTAGRGEQTTGRGKQTAGRGEQTAGRGEQTAGRSEQPLPRDERITGRGKQASAQGRRASTQSKPMPGELLGASSAGLHTRLALAGLLGGVGLLTLAEAPWAHGIGVACLFACMILAFLAVNPAGMAAVEADRDGG